MYNNNILYVLLLLLCNITTNAQSYNVITITKDNLIQGSTTGSNNQYPLYYSSSSNSIDASISIETLSPYFTHNSANSSFNFAVSERSISVRAAKPNAYVGGSTTLQSGTRRNIFSSQANSHGGDPQYNLIDGDILHLYFGIPNFGKYVWNAGDYENSTRVSTDRSGTSIRTESQNVIIRIPTLAGITNGSWNIWTTAVNSLVQYETGLTGTAMAQTLVHTVPVTAKVRALSTNFTAVDLQNKPMDIEIPINVLQYSMGGGQITMSTDDQTVFTVSSIPAGNKTMLPAENLYISSADLKKYFNKPGTYTILLSSSFWHREKGGLVEQYKHSLKIQVADLSKLQLGANQVSLSLKSVNDYTEGVSKDYSDHLIVSQLSPFTITVKANGESFTRVNGDASIPVSALQIGPASGQDPTEFNIVKLSTSPQNLIISAPVLEKKYGIKYSIPAANAKKILDNAPNNTVVSGTYNGVVIYTMTAL